jgi:DnaJ-related protein SCJ1
MPEGHTIGFENMCDEIAGSSEAPGDVNFKVQTTTLSSALSREGNDLRLQISITLQESLVGFKKEVLHLDGHIVELNRTGKVTSHGLIERIEGEGMPIHERPSEFGDLIVVYSVGFPDTLTDPQKDVLQSVLD